MRWEILCTLSVWPVLKERLTGWHTLSPTHAHINWCFFFMSLCSNVNPFPCFVLFVTVGEPQPKWVGITTYTQLSELLCGATQNKRYCRDYNGCKFCMIYCHLQYWYPCLRVSTAITSDMFSLWMVWRCLIRVLFHWRLRRKCINCFLMQEELIWKQEETFHTFAGVLKSTYTYRYKNSLKNYVDTWVAQMVELLSSNWEAPCSLYFIWTVYCVAKILRFEHAGHNSYILQMGHTVTPVE